MKNFFRAASYMLPYRARLIAAVLCVLMVAMLWAGGLGAILPGAKILISEEGLHGWADQTVVHSRLGINTVKVQFSEPLEINGHILADVMAVNSASEKTPAAIAGIKPGQYIIGIDDRILPFDLLHQALAAQGEQGDWNLRVYNPSTARVETVQVTPEPAGKRASLLYSAAERLPRAHSRSERLPLLIGMLAIGAIITILRNAFRFLQEYLVQTTVVRAMMDLRCDNFHVAMRLPLSFYANEGSTDTMSRFINDTHQVSRGLTTLFGKTLVEPAKAVFTFAVALALDWQLTLLASIAGPPAYFLIRRLGKMMRRASRKVLESSAKMLEVLEETFSGIRVVKAFTTEPAEEKRFRGVNREMYKQLKPMCAIDSATGPSVETLGIVAAMIAVGFAGYLVLGGRMDQEAFLALMATLAALYDPVRKLSEVSTRFHSADAAAERIFELQDRPVEHDPPDAVKLPRHARSLEFSNVTFAYPKASRPAIADVNLRIKQGESVAVVGSNGSGKTTLLSLVPRFFIPQSGSIFIDGIDIAEASLPSLRRQIGIVTQETVMFHASIADNIAYGTENATREQIIAAAKKAFVHDFVQQIPHGYDAIVGEKGATLSGGQRQRIAIARAIMRDPAILIFDEAMSQIDSESEAKINLALTDFMAGRTTLLIAHRFSTVIGADRVIVMVDGRIIDNGKHDELLLRCPTYKTLFETQLFAQ